MDRHQQAEQVRPIGDIESKNINGAIPVTKTLSNEFYRDLELMIEGLVVQIPVPTVYMFKVSLGKILNLWLSLAGTRSCHQLVYECVSEWVNGMPLYSILGSYECAGKLLF